MPWTALPLCLLLTLIVNAQIFQKHGEQRQALNINDNPSSSQSLSSVGTPAASRPQTENIQGLDTDPRLSMTTTVESTDSSGVIVSDGMSDTQNNGSSGYSNSAQATPLQAEILVKTWNSKTSMKEPVFVKVSQDVYGLRVNVDIGGSDKTCNHEEYRHFFRNETDLKTIFDAKLGPDEIIIQLLGASLQTQIAWSIDFCGKYYAYFQVPQEGRYRLKVFRLRQHYYALREIPDFARMKADVWVDEALPSVQSRYTPMGCNDMNVNGYWVANPDVSVDSNLLDDPLTMHPICPGSDAKDAALTEQRGFPSMTSYVKVEKVYGEKENCANNVDLYNWNLDVCKNKQSRSDGEIIDVMGSNVTSRAHSSLVRGKKIMFVGDSHMRGLAEMFMDVTCRYKTAIEEGDIIDRTELRKVQYFEFTEEKYDKYYSKMSKKSRCRDLEDDMLREDCSKLFHDDCMGTTIAYLGQMLCQHDMLDGSEEFDYVIFNCGHHPASKDHFSFQKFRLSVRTLLLSPKVQDATDKTSYLWLENTAQPLRQDHWVFDKQDWRTYHRLMLFDFIVRQELRAAKFPARYIPAFYSTLALFDKMCDCAHYPQSAKMPQLLGMLDKIAEGTGNGTP